MGDRRLRPLSPLSRHKMEVPDLLTDTNQLIKKREKEREEGMKQKIKRGRGKTSESESKGDEKRAHSALGADADDAGQPLKSFGIDRSVLALHI